MKKGQTEIIGLMVIVILFIFVGLIYIMFAGKEDTGSLTRDVTQSVKVQNMLDSYTQFTPCYTELPYPQMREVIMDCYTSGEKTCGEDCETLITETLDDMIKAYSSSQEYQFIIRDPKKEEFIIVGEECPGEAKAATALIVVGGQSLTLNLIFCA